MGDVASRFWPKVDKRSDGECWPWLGSMSKGYGQLSAGQRGAAPLKAHRVSYEFAHGPIAHGLVIRHACDNPQCVNPAHLLAGSQRENVLDMVERNRVSPRSRENLAAKQRRAFDEPHAEMIRTLAAAHMSRTEIGRLFGTDRSTVSLYTRGKR